jgi:hypothetical protein
MRGGAASGAVRAEDRRHPPYKQEIFCISVAMYLYGALFLVETPILRINGAPMAGSGAGHHTFP